MSTIGARNFLLNNENSALKNSERKHTTKKQAFGEIKNVIHNKEIRGTPFKAGGAPVTLKSLSSSISSKDSLKKQSFKIQLNERQKTEQKSKILQRDSIDIDEDFEIEPKAIHHRDCNRDLLDIWSEANILQPEILEKIVNFRNDEKDENKEDSNSQKSLTTEELFAELDSNSFNSGELVDSTMSKDIQSWKLFQEPTNTFDDFDSDDMLLDI